MKNLIRFETADRPLTSGKSKFPYGEALQSLRVLESTKSLVISEKECSWNNINQLRKHARKHALGFVKACKQNGKVYLWLDKE